MKSGTRTDAGWAARRLSLLLLLCCFASPALGLPVELSFDVVAPTPATIELGSPVFVEVSIAGLTDGDAPSLTSIDLDITFDDIMFDFVDVTFQTFTGVNITNGSGDPCTFENLDANCDVLLDSSSGAGLIELAATSLVDPADVNANQPASGVFALLELLATAGGTSSLVFSSVDVAGTLSGTTQGTLPFTTTSEPLEVLPEPALVVLLGSGVAAIGWRRARHGSKRAA